MFPCLIQAEYEDRDEPHHQHWPEQGANFARSTRAAAGLGARHRPPPALGGLVLCHQRRRAGERTAGDRVRALLVRAGARVVVHVAALNRHLHTVGTAEIEQSINQSISERASAASRATWERLFN